MLKGIKLYCNRKLLYFKFSLIDLNPGQSGKDQIKIWAEMNMIKAVFIDFAMNQTHMKLNGNR